MKLKTLLRRIALQRKEDFPFPDDLESYLADFVPNALLKSESLQRAFGISNYEMEKLYEEAYAYYENEQYLKAVTVFRWLVLFNSYEPKYWMGFAASEQLLERYEKALHAYAVVSLLESENPYPHYHAYECYMLLDNKEDADKALALAKRRCENSSNYDELKQEIEELKLPVAQT